MLLFHTAGSTPSSPTRPEVAPGTSAGVPTCKDCEEAKEALQTAAVAIKKLKVKAAVALVLSLLVALISLLPGCKELWSLPVIGLLAFNVVGRWIDMLGACLDLERPTLRVRKVCNLTRAEVWNMAKAYICRAGRSISIILTWL